MSAASLRSAAPTSFGLQRYYFFFDIRKHHPPQKKAPDTHKNPILHSLNHLQIKKKTHFFLSKNDKNHIEKR